MTLRFRSLLFAAAVSAAALPAQDPPTERGPELDADSIVLSVDQDTGMPMTEFIALAQALTGKTITYAEQDVAGARVRFVGTKKMKKTAFFDFFRTMLHINGLHTQVTDAGSDTELVRISVLEPMDPSSLGVAAHAPALLTVRHVDAAETAARLGALLSGAKIEAKTLSGDGGSSLPVIYITGTPTQLLAATRILQLIDVPAPVEASQVVRLQHAEAEPFAAELSALLSEHRKVTVVAHGRHNALLITGEEGAVASVLDVIALLDQPRR